MASGSSSLQEVLCCLGQPVAGNPTQYVMEKALAAAGLDWRYLTFEVAPQNLADAVRGLKALGFRGANFTIPHKVAAVPLLDRLGKSAQLIGAVNCAVREGDVWRGENTDGRGFVQSLRPLVDPAGLTVVILGAGGAARAIAVELALAGATRFVIVNRTLAHARAMVELLTEGTRVQAEAVALDGPYAVPQEAGLVVNATSVGMGDPEARLPLVVETLRPELVVADVVYHPPQTWLLQTARQRGCRTLDGLGMFVNQAALSFELWTGQTPDAAVMRDALEEFLEI
jgi:shikimate dehydrogenase